MDVNIISMLSSAREYKKYQQLLRDEQYVRIELKRSVNRKLEVEMQVDVLSDNIKEMKKNESADKNNLNDLKKLLNEKQFQLKEEKRSITQKYKDLDESKKRRKDKWNELLRNEAFIYLAGTNSLDKYLLRL